MQTTVDNVQRGFQARPDQIAIGFPKESHDVLWLMAEVYTYLLMDTNGVGWGMKEKMNQCDMQQESLTPTERGS